MKLREAPILDAVLVALKRNPRVYAWRNHVGLFLAVSGKVGDAADALRRAGIASRVVAVGDNGAADVLAVVGGQVCANCGAAVHPLPVAFEVKSADGRQRADQRDWQAHVWERRGARYVLARSAEEALAALGVNRGD